MLRGPSYFLGRPVFFETDMVWQRVSFFMCSLYLIEYNYTEIDK